MVDISAKPTTLRLATATGSIKMSQETVATIRSGTSSKGDVLGIARLAAISATKWTSVLIPLCHVIPIEGVEVRFDFTDDDTLTCWVDVRTSAKTGVEMEALTAASVACLTVYDMCKSMDRAMTIDHVRLLHKEGGKSGCYKAS